MGWGDYLKRWLSKLNPILILILLIFAAIFYSVVFLNLSSLNDNRILTNIKILSTVLFLILPLIILAGVIFGLMANKWAFKLEKVSLGGFNLLFDNPVRLYKRTIRSLLDTKRTLFKIDFERDNFDETLTSYYKTYEFFRNEMKILDSERRRGKWRKKEQRELYDVTNNILQVLNEFLTSHQNNFRRWYKYISEKNEVKKISGEGDSLEFHMTPISEIQRQFYRYEEICRGFEEVNRFFVTEVNQYFEVNLEKWESVN